MSNRELRKELIDFLEWFWSQNKVSIFEMDDVTVDAYMSWRKPKSLLGSEQDVQVSDTTGLNQGTKAK